MQIDHDASPNCASTCASGASRGESIAFVPTMGNLHAGHASLVGAAHLHGRRVVASIFVNPLQFGPSEDFARLSAHAGRRSALLAEPARRCCSCRPWTRCIPKGTTGSTVVDVPELSDILCGAFRPGHFQGVATVVVKLFSIVQPDVAIFGEKDYQQLTIIRRIGRGPVPAGEDRRRADGARRRRSRAEFAQPLPDAAGARARAAALSRARPRAAAARVRRHGCRRHRARRAARRSAAPASARTTSRCAWPSTLAQPSGRNVRLVVLAAARLGRARLIDNLQCRAPASSRKAASD